MTRKQIAITLSLIVAVLLTILFFGRGGLSPARETAHAELQPINKAAQHKTWVCPMHPEISQGHPGTCPICGMKLVESGATDNHEHGVRVDSATEQRMGIRLAGIKQGLIGQAVRTYGNVVAAEDAVFSVQPKYEGWIKKLYVHAVGDTVKAGQVLYEIYSPDLITRQRTYLSGIERRKQFLQTIQTTPDTENDYVMEMAMDGNNDRVKLHQEDGLSIESIQTIEERKQASDVVQIVAAYSGVVTQLNVKEGALVMPSAVMMTLADTSRIWIDVPLYPDQAGLVHVGDSVMLGATGQENISARIDYISPLADANKVRARIYLDNRRYRLRPGTFADVSIRIQPHEALLLPRSAIIYSPQGNSVMLSMGDGHFLPVHVETGVEEGEQVELLEGLRAGSEVAVNGQFLLDAASSMNAAIERMSTQRP
jgi:Cu(I)/Ag(I) efflux system membrane fusion protein